MPRPSRVSPALWIWLSARQLSEIGTSLNTIVISVYALALFDNPAVLGLILALRMGGSVVGALLAPILSGGYRTGPSWWRRISPTAR